MTDVSNIQVNATPTASASPLEAMKDTRPNELTTADAQGRNITVRRSTPLDLFRLTKVYGDKATQATLNLAMIVSSVTAIDGERVVPPGTDRQIEALFARLGWDGFITARNLTTQLDPPADTDGLELAKN
jgi:hypothetical protein